MQQFQDIGEDAHGGDVWSSSRALHHQGTLLVPRGRKRDQIVGSARRGKRMFGRQLLECRARAVAIDCPAAGFVLAVNCD